MAIVVKAFFDAKDNKKLYQVGDIYTGARVDYLTNLGFLGADKPQVESTTNYNKLKKDELQDLLTEKGIEFTQNETKAELLEKLK